MLFMRSDFSGQNCNLSSSGYIATIERDEMLNDDNGLPISCAVAVDSPGYKTISASHCNNTTTIRRLSKAAVVLLPLLPPPPPPGKTYGGMRHVFLSIPRYFRQSALVFTALP